MRIGDDLVFHHTALARLREMLAARRPARFGVGAFKEWTGISRKYAIPLLEYLDREHVTRREGRSGCCCKMGTDMGTTTALVTFGEFERLPDEECKLELMDGEVLRMPPAETRHMRIAMRLYDFLKDALCGLHGRRQGADLGEVWIETGYHMGNTWLISDVSITHASQLEDKYLEGAPALAIEVISECNTAPKMRRKIRKYFEHGCREVWVVDPETASVQVQIGKTAVEHEGQLSSDLLPGVSIDLAPIFL